MSDAKPRTVCWSPTWNEEHNGEGLEHLLLSERAADSVILPLTRSTVRFGSPIDSRGTSPGRFARPILRSRRSAAFDR